MLMICLEIEYDANISKIFVYVDNYWKIFTRNMFNAAICSYHGCYACFWLAGMGGIKSRPGEGFLNLFPRADFGQVIIYLSILWKSYLSSLALRSMTLRGALPDVDSM